MFSFFLYFRNDFSSLLLFSRLALERALVGKSDPMPLLMGRFCRVSHLEFLCLKSIAKKGIRQVAQSFSIPSPFLEEMKVN